MNQTEREATILGRWANSRVGSRFRGQRIYGWTLDGAPSGCVRLFTDHACTKSIVARPPGTRS